MKKLTALIAVAILGSAGIFGQNSSVILDTAISNSMNYLVNRLHPDTKVVVLNFNAPAQALSDYVIDELTAYLVNDGNLTVVDRRNLELLQQDMNFQLSGEVSESTAQSMGQKLGAQYIVSGNMAPPGAVYRMRVQAIAVESAKIEGVAANNAGGEMLSDKPVKKTPARRGNFEITQGYKLRTPVDMRKFKTAAVNAMKALKYTIDEEGLGYITFTVGSPKSWWRRIKLCYWTDGYLYEYVNSYELGANPAKNKIHGNYDDWIANVEKQLAARYKQL
jgi:TolB-like protein